MLSLKGSVTVPIVHPYDLGRKIGLRRRSRARFMRARHREVGAADATLTSDGWLSWLGRLDKGGNRGDSSLSLLEA
jgi:hypothetical protein